jgi:hypothetical protein
MELRNYQYLTEDVLPQLGFSGTFDAALKTKMELGMKDFELKAKSVENETEMSYALTFRKGEGEYYFLNQVKATRVDKGMEPVEQTFSLFKQRGYGATEMKNMLREGASVYKTFRKDGQTVGRWTRLDLTKTGENGNHPVKSYYDNTTGFNLVRELSKLPIINASQEEKELLIKSLQSGDRASVSMKQNGQRERMYIEATPYLGRLALYNAKMEKISLTNTNLQVVQDEKMEQAVAGPNTKLVAAQATEKLPETTKQLMQKLDGPAQEGQQIKRKVS